MYHAVVLWVMTITFLLYSPHVQITESIIKPWYLLWSCWL